MFCEKRSFPYAKHLPLWQRKLSGTLKLELVVDCEPHPERAVGKVCRKELDEGTVRGGSSQVCSGGNPDPSLPAMRHDGLTALGGETAHSPGFGEPSDTADVWLHNVDVTQVHQLEHFKPCGLPLAVRNLENGKVKKKRKEKKYDCEMECFFKKNNK